MTRTLIAGVGFTNLRDMSVGPLLAEQLAAEAWPPGVDVRDFGYGAVHATHDLQDLQAGERLARLVVFGAAPRGRAPGTVTCYRWDGALPDAEAVQAQVAEAVTGTISIDGLLVVGQQFGALPDEVIVVEIEPADESWGPGCSPAVEASLGLASATIRVAALSPAAPTPPLPLGASTANVTGQRGTEESLRRALE